MIRAKVAALSLVMLALPSGLVAGSVSLNGTKYNERDYERAVADFRSILNNRVAAFSPKTLTDLGLQPIGGRMLVVLPSIDTATLNYVYTRTSSAKRDINMQHTIARTEIARIEYVFRLMERITFIQNAVFIDDQTYLLNGSAGYEYVVTLHPTFDGNRSQEAASRRHTEFILAGVKSGRQTVALTTIGSPGMVSPDYAVRQFKAASEKVM